MDIIETKYPRKIMKTIAKEGDEAFMKAIENEKDLGKAKEE